MLGHLARFLFRIEGVRAGSRLLAFELDDISLGRLQLVVESLVRCCLPLASLLDALNLFQLRLDVLLSCILLLLGTLGVIVLDLQIFEEFVVFLFDLAHFLLLLSELAL